MRAVPAAPLVDAPPGTAPPGTAPPGTAPPELAAPPPIAEPEEHLDARVIGAVAVFAFEAVEGTRQIAQLGRWITESVASELAELRRLNIERRSLYRDERRVVPTVRRVRAMQPGHVVAEAAVVLTAAGRARAVALRFELIRQRWQATSVTVL
ncbi:hypothetical protein GCM10020360_07440 [Nonlabens tegetincola]